MPIYEYACAKCGELMEVLQKMSDPGPSKCEHCGSKRVQRVMSQTSFQLKGDGWYITDYARKGKKDGGSDKAEKSESGNKDTNKETSKETSKETKKDAKKDSKSKKAS